MHNEEEQERKRWNILIEEETIDKRPYESEKRLYKLIKF